MVSSALDFVKLNVDATINLEDGRCGYGAIIHGAGGSFMGGFFVFSNHCFDVTAVEGAEFLKELLLLHDLGYSPCYYRVELS